MRVRCRQPGEWWYDEATQELFLWPNSTAPDGVLAAAQEELVVPVLQTLIRFKGTVSHHDIAGIWVAFFQDCQQSSCEQAKAPVVGVTISGVNFRDAAYTFMEQFGVPSGGDWSLYRGGAIFVEGTEQLTLREGLYRRLDGNAIFLSGYNRNATIAKNELVFIGDNAIASCKPTFPNHQGFGLRFGNLWPA